ncbi:hypothetical protein ACFE04_012485 [Oxalis oulophora]
MANVSINLQLSLNVDEICEICKIKPAVLSNGINIVEAIKAIKADTSSTEKEKSKRKQQPCPKTHPQSFYDGLLLARELGKDRRDTDMIPTDVVGVNVGLAFIDAIIALLAFTQLLRIHTRNPQLGWNRQKVFHLLIGSSSLVLLLHATSGNAGLIFVVLSSWITALDFVLMVTFAVLIWIGKGSSSIDSSDTATVYIDLMAGAMLLLGGALAVYGLLLCLKMRKVRSERASSEVWKVASLAAVCLTCFTTSGVVALSTYIPMLYWRQPSINGVYTSLLLIAYYFIGASVPSAFLLWVMRDIPPAAVPANTDEESRTIAYIHDSSATGPNRWTIATTSQNQRQHGHFVDEKSSIGPFGLSDLLHMVELLVNFSFRFHSNESHFIVLEIHKLQNDFGTCITITLKEVLELRKGKPKEALESN